MDRRYWRWDSYARLEALLSEPRVEGAYICYGWKNLAATTNSPALQLSVTGGGRHPRFGEVKDVLFDQIVVPRLTKGKVSRQWIQASARELAKAELYDEVSAHLTSGLLD